MGQKEKERLIELIKDSSPVSIEVEYGTKYSSVDLIYALYGKAVRIIDSKIAVDKVQITYVITYTSGIHWKTLKPVEGVGIELDAHAVLLKQILPSLLESDEIKTFLSLLLKYNRNHITAYNYDQTQLLKLMALIDGDGIQDRLLWRNTEYDRILVDAGLMDESNAYTVYFAPIPDDDLEIILRTHLKIINRREE